MASLMSSSLKACTSVWIGCLFGGGVLIMERSLAAINENCSVLGIGVAVSVRVSTSVFRLLNFSLEATPNFCSSSMTSNPKSLKWVSFPNKL